MSSAKVLFVLEGEQPEGNIVARLQKAFPKELADLSENLVKYVCYHILTDCSTNSEIVLTFKLARNTYAS